jgi:hypothetical protein
MNRIPSAHRLHVRFAACAAFALACATFAGPAASAEHLYQSIDYPGATATEVFAVNDLRQFVGVERDADGVHHAIFNDGSGFTTIDLTSVGAAQSWAFSINTRTDIAGTFIDAAGMQHGYVHHADGRIETLDFPGGNNTQGYGVNDRGTVIGLYNDAQDVSHAYARIKGEFVDIDIAGGVATVPLSVNDSNEIVGQFERTDGTTGYGFVRHADGRVTLHSAPGAPDQSTFFISANNRGGVLGTWVDADGNYVNFLRKMAKYYPVNLPDSFQSQFTSAQTINDLNDIVGYYLGADGLVHGWLAWTTHSGQSK